MTANPGPEMFPVRVWFNPVKLWKVTEKMGQAEADELVEHVSLLAEQRDFGALRQYDFVRVGPYRDIRWS